MPKTITVMHVDDDEDIRVIADLAFSLDSDFELVQCASGLEAIEKAKDLHPDVLLLDMVMPNMDGEQTWERLKAESGMADTPTIFMSARAEKQFSDHLMKMGATAVITKPFDPLTLCSEIKSALQDSAAASKQNGPGVVDFPS
jgi:CheY-like chemotaxis protein